MLQPEVLDESAARGRPEHKLRYPSLLGSSFSLLARVWPVSAELFAGRSLCDNENWGRASKEFPPKPTITWQRSLVELKRGSTKIKNGFAF